MHYSGTTESVNAPITPNYKLINVAGENGGTEHIKAVNNHGGNADSEFAIVDNDMVSAWVRNDWGWAAFPGRIKITNGDPRRQLYDGHRGPIRIRLRSLHIPMRPSSTGRREADTGAGSRHLQQKNQL